MRNGTYRSFGNWRSQQLHPRTQQSAKHRMKDVLHVQIVELHHRSNKELLDPAVAQDLPVHMRLDRDSLRFLLVLAC